MNTLIKLLAIYFICIPLHSQTISWGGAQSTNGSFDGGLNNWTTVGVYSSQPDSFKNAVWNWSDQGTAEQGVFWDPSMQGIASETQNNGAAVFNSDYLDNGGSISDIGEGPAPAPHRGELISPVIDCSGLNTVGLYFTQYLRIDNAETYVMVSGDDGQNWTRYDIETNQELKEGGTSSRSAQEYLDISETAAGQEEVRIKFVFNGAYYFWIIDDVAVGSLPEHDMKITGLPYPMNSYRMPSDLIDCQNVSLSMGIENVGTQDQSGVELMVSITDESGNEVFSTSEPIGTFASGQSDTIDFSSNFIPEGLSNGTYDINYEVSADSVDFNPEDNRDTLNFEVSYRTYSKDTDGYGTGYRSSLLPDSWSVANLYRHCQFEPPVYDAVAKEVHWSFSTGDDNISLEGDTATVWVAQLDRYICPDNLDFFNEEMTDPFNHVDLTVIGFNRIPLEGLPKDSLIKTELYDYQYLLDNGSYKNYAPLNDENGCFFAGITLPGDLYVIFDETIDYDPQKVNTTVVLPNSQWYLGGFQGSLNAVVRAVIEPVIGDAINGPSLPEQAVQLHPNPARQSVRVSFDLDHPQQVRLRWSDMSGRTIRTDELNSVIQDDWSTSIEGLEAGTYFIHVMAEDGSRTLKLIKH